MILGKERAMKQQIKTIQEHPGTLEIRLNDPAAYDAAMIDQIRNDELCITPSVRHDMTLCYSLENKVPLRHFLEHYTFAQQEGYEFLTSLFEKAIAANRTKPVLLDINYIYLSRNGIGVSFVVIPLKMDFWLYQKEETGEFIRQLLDVFRTETSYEIAGYLLTVLSSQEFSLPNLVLGLKAVRRMYYPPKWFERFLAKERPAFCAAEQVGAYICETVPEAENAMPAREDKIIHTQIIGAIRQDNPYLLSEDGQQYDLLFEQMTVGRAMSCDIRLEHADISLKHAKIIQSEGRCYIQDLKSSNGTFLNEKRVQRRMRLREGMKVVFAEHTYTFHE